MSHDFSIETEKESYFFFGLAEDRLYKVFNVIQHNNGVSGDGVTFTAAKGKFIDDLITFCEWIKENYPDPTRADNLEQFIADTVDDDSATEYAINFS